jgi:hypothetical protein
MGSTLEPRIRARFADDSSAGFSVDSSKRLSFDSPSDRLEDGELEPPASRPSARAVDAPFDNQLQFQSDADREGRKFKDNAHRPIQIDGKSAPPQPSATAFELEREAVFPVDAPTLRPANHRSASPIGEYENVSRGARMPVRPESSRPPAPLPPGRVDETSSSEQPAGAFETAKPKSPVALERAFRESSDETLILMPREPAPSSLNRSAERAAAGPSRRSIPAELRGDESPGPATRLEAPQIAKPAEITIEIGRIEVRAVPPAKTSQPTPRRREFRPKTSLTDYLDRRRGDNR